MGYLIERGLPCPHCNSSDAYSIYSDSEHCFSCKKGKYIGNTKLVKENVDVIKGLPKDFDLEIPALGLNWLFKNGLNKQLISDYYIGYSKSWNRVIIPSFYKDKLLGWQGRVLNNSEPKYLQSAGNKPLLFVNHLAQNPHDYLFIVEDALSAISIGRFVAAIALLDTSINYNKLSFMTNMSQNIILWLDGDKPGQTAARKLSKFLEQTGRNVLANVITNKDPKEHTIQELKRIVLGIGKSYEIRNVA